MASKPRLLLLCLISLLISGIAHSQAPSTGQANKPDSTQAQADLEKAKAIAGSTWALEEHVICDLPTIPRLPTRVRKSYSIISTPFLATIRNLTE